MFGEKHFKETLEELHLWRIKKVCPNCKKEYVPDLGERKHPELLIQQEFPDAEPYQREQLITGICSDECWDEYLGG